MDKSLTNFFVMENLVKNSVSKKIIFFSVTLFAKKEKLISFLWVEDIWKVSQQQLLILPNRWKILAEKMFKEPKFRQYNGISKTK